MRKVVFATGLALLALPAIAADVAKEETTNGNSVVTLYLHHFLDATELATLRLVATNKDALALFVPSDKGFAALAVAPDEGFVKDGKPVASAIALSDLPDAETASIDALKACNTARTTDAECVLLLQVGPKP